MPAHSETMAYPVRMGNMTLYTDVWSSSIQWKSFKKLFQAVCISLYFNPVTREPALTDNKNSGMLNHMFVITLPSKALALFILNRIAKNNAAIGPVPGIIPKNTPRPTPIAIF